MNFPQPKHYPFSILTAVTIVALSLYPFTDIKITVDIPLMDKWTHMVMYGGLCSVIWVEYLKRHRRISLLDTGFWAVLLPILMGGTLELMQAYLTSTRSGEWLDFLANSIGVCIAGVLGSTLLRLIVKPRN